MFPLTITLHNSTQLQAVLNALEPDGAFDVTERVALEQGQSKPKADPAKKSAATEKTAAAATPSTATGQESAATKSAETSGESPASNDKIFTIDDAKALTMKIVADKGRDAAVTLLKKYDVPVAAKLPADKVAAFCTEAEQVLA